MNPDLLIGQFDDHDNGQGPAIQLASGGRFHVLHPSSNEVDLYDIAYALSNICRYTGHCMPFYSVAQHCIHVSYLVPPELALYGLFHDAAEAYVGDVSRPLKLAIEQTSPGAYSKIESAVEGVIFEKFGLLDTEAIMADIHEAVKVADNVACATEFRDIMPATAAPLHDLPDPDPERLFPLTPGQARMMFIVRYDELSREEE